MVTDADDDDADADDDDDDDADVLAPTCIYLCNLVVSGQHISAGCASSGLAQLQSSFFR